MAKSFTELKVLDAQVAKDMGVFRKEPTQASFDAVIASMAKFAEGMDCKLKVGK